MSRHLKDEAFATIVSQLSSELLEAHPKPADRTIPEQPVATRLETSRPLVPKPRRHREHAGRFVVLPNPGARAAFLDLGELKKVYFLRERLEPLLVQRSAVARVPEPEIETMAREQRWLERAAPKQHEADWLAHDRRFHMASLAGVSSQRLRSIVENLWNLAEPYRRAYLSARSGPLEPTLLEHRLLLDAVERSDGEDAARILQLHIRRTRLGLAAMPELLAT